MTPHALLRACVHACKQACLEWASKHAAEEGLEWFDGKHVFFCCYEARVHAAFEDAVRRAASHRLRPPSHALSRRLAPHRLTPSHAPSHAPSQVRRFSEHSLRPVWSPDAAPRPEFTSHGGFMGPGGGGDLGGLMAAMMAGR